MKYLTFLFASAFLYGCASKPVGDDLVRIGSVARTGSSIAGALGNYSGAQSLGATSKVSTLVGQQIQQNARQEEQLSQEGREENSEEYAKKSPLPEFPSYFNCADEHMYSYRNFYCTNEDKSISIIISPTSYNSKGIPDENKPWQVTAQVNDGSGQCLLPHSDMSPFAGEAVAKVCNNELLKLRSDVNLNSKEGFELCGFSDRYPGFRIFFYKFKWMNSINEFMRTWSPSGKINCTLFSLENPF